MSESNQGTTPESVTNDLSNVSLSDAKFDASKVPAFTPGAAAAFVPGQTQNYQQGQGYSNYQGGQGYSNYQGGQGYSNYQQGGQGGQGYSNYQGGQGYNNYQQGGQGGQSGQGYSNYQGGQGYNNYQQGGQSGQGYSNYQGGQGYNNYQQGGQSYNSYQQGYQAPQQGGAMSLEDYKKQQQASLNTLNKPIKKTTLKLDASSGIKLANAPKKVETPKVETPKVETPKEITPVPAKAETPKAETPKETTPAPAKVETPKKATPTPAKVETKASNVSSTTASATASVDALIKEQEDEVDLEVVNDLFGGKDHVSIIFMGHVDAGKSTMGGNILYLTGSVDKRTIEKYEREAKDAGRQGWYLSWVMDTNKEERNDGKTIEVGKAYFETEKRRYTLLDAPGHKMYVSEMIGGASQADIGILVISARKGEYETGFEKGGQTREHALLAKTQGVNKIIVVINKMDDVTVAWSNERYTECCTKLGQYLKGIGYAKDDIIFMPVSGYTGAGLKERVKPEECPWYSGPSLLEYLDEMKTVDRHVNSPFMLPIAGKMKDMGTIVEGKIESGHVKKGQNLIVMPNKTTVEVLSIFNETEQECEAAYCGEQVRMKLRGIEEEDLTQGYVLSSIKNPVKTVTRFEAQVAMVELKSILSNGFSCVMHVHTAIEEVTFVELKHKLERGTNRKSRKPPAFAKKGMKVIAILETTELVCVETYADYPQLGRFTLRDQGTTIAIGKITKLL